MFLSLLWLDFNPIVYLEDKHDSKLLYEIFPHCFWWNYATFSDNNAHVIGKQTAWLQLITHYRHREHPDEKEL